MILAKHELLSEVHKPLASVYITETRFPVVEIDNKTAHILFARTLLCPNCSNMLTYFRILVAPNPLPMARYCLLLREHIYTHLRTEQPPTIVVNPNASISNTTIEYLRRQR
jgi:hypothetical protein